MGKSKVNEGPEQYYTVANASEMKNLGIHLVDVNIFHWISEKFGGVSGRVRGSQKKSAGFISWGTTDLCTTFQCNPSYNCQDKVTKIQKCQAHSVGGS